MRKLLHYDPDDPLVQEDEEDDGELMYMLVNMQEHLNKIPRPERRAAQNHLCCSLLFSNHSITAISNHLEWNRNTISKYASLVSDACVAYNERDFESQKGTWGSGHGRRVRVVVWDETMVGARRKYNMGRAWHNKTWISGGVEIETQKGTFHIRRAAIEVLPPMVGRRRDLILPGVKRLVKRGSAVWTDTLNIYQALSPRYRHSTVNHSKKEFKAKDGTTTNPAESLWRESHEENDEERVV